MAFARSVKSPQRLMRLMGFKLTGASGALTEGQFDAVGSRAGAGDYTITFNEAFLRAPVVHANSSGGNHIIQVVPLVGSVQLLVKTDAGVAADANLDIVVLGADTADQI